MFDILVQTLTPFPRSSWICSGQFAPTTGAWRWRKRGNGDGHHSGWRWTHLQSTRPIPAACLFDVWIFVLGGCTNMPQADWMFSFQAVLSTFIYCLNLRSFSSKNIQLIPINIIHDVYCILLPTHVVIILFQIKLQPRSLEDNWPSPLFWNLQCVCLMAYCRVNIWKLWGNAVEGVFRLERDGHWQCETSPEMILR